MNFGQALEQSKAGNKVAREGWNGKNQFVFMRPADDIGISAVIDVVKSLPQSVKDHFKREDAKRDGSEQGLTKIKFTAYLCLYNAQGEIVNGWVPSQGDLFAEDWIRID